MQSEIPPLHVVVKFGKDVPLDAQGCALLELELSLRGSTGLRIEVFKEAKGDDSKLRSAMTLQQRARL